MEWTKPGEGRPENLLVRAMRSVSGSRTALRAQSVLLEQGEVVCEPGDAVRHVYFPVSCVLSAVSVHGDGTVLATTLRGHEGAFGLLTGLRKARTHARCQVQIGGTALRMETNQLAFAFDARREVRHLFLSYWDAVMTQYEQPAICNTKHSVSSRLSKCLLDIYDRVIGDVFPFTHQHMANLIAANRTTVSLVAASLRRCGLIETNRANVRIIDPEGLRVATCECYARVRRQYEMVLRS
jgi:CRP-like cAMP-binding protein